MCLRQIGPVDEHSRIPAHGQIPHDARASGPAANNDDISRQIPHDNNLSRPGDYGGLGWWV